MSPSRSLFITFEGAEGCGKSTQVSMLAERLLNQDNPHPIKLVREPGSTELGEQIRALFKKTKMTAMAELMLMSASRAELVQTVIQPALDEGCIVICDRFYDSTTAYQGYGRGLNSHIVRAVTAFCTHALEPDLTFYLALDEKEAGIRLVQRGVELDRMEQEQADFFKRVRHGFESVAREDPFRVERIDATLSRDTIANMVWNRVRQKLSKP